MFCTSLFSFFFSPDLGVRNLPTILPSEKFQTIETLLVFPPFPLFLGKERGKFGKQLLNKNSGPSVAVALPNLLIYPLPESHALQLQQLNLSCSRQTHSTHIIPTQLPPSSTAPQLPLIPLKRRCWKSLNHQLQKQQTGTASRRPRQKQGPIRVPSGQIILKNETTIRGNGSVIIRSLDSFIKSADTYGRSWLCYCSSTSQKISRSSKNPAKQQSKHLSMALTNIVRLHHGTGVICPRTRRPRERRRLSPVAWDAAFPPSAVLGTISMGGERLRESLDEAITGQPN